LPLLTTVPLFVTPELLMTGQLVVVIPLVVRFCVVTLPRARFCHERDETIDAVTPELFATLYAIAESRLVVVFTPLVSDVISEPLVVRV
jgi:hypothetical protein